jgi:hypothetical protein
MSIFDCKNDLQHGDRITTEFKFIGFIYIYIYIYIYTVYTGVPGGKDLTSGECSLGQTIPI